MLYFLFFFLLSCCCCLQTAKKHQMIIKFADMPTCRHCLFYRAPPTTSSTASLGRCTKYGTQHIVTGRIEFMDAVIARTQEGYCGIQGNAFVPLPRKTTPWTLFKRRFHIECQLWWRWWKRILHIQSQPGCDCECNEDGCKTVGCDDCEVVPLLRFMIRK